MVRDVRRAAAYVLLWCLAGCAAHNVKFSPVFNCKIPPVERATAVEGQIEEANNMAAQAALPHYTVRERFDLLRQVSRSLTTPLGSPDYIVIGEVYGGGNNKTTLETLKAALCKKAASKGGDVVLVFQAGIEERPFVFSTPGYANTNVYSSAYRSGPYVYGNSTACTTYTPGQTYAGVLHLPRANGLVFKYVPGVEQRRESMAALSDADLEHVLQTLETMQQDKSLTLQEVLDCWDQMLAGPATTQPAGP